MSRLIAFGCSYTYGQGMADCYITNTKPGPVPSQYAWPNVLSKLLDKECLNLSVPGCSNKRICYDILNTEFKQDDTVIVSWTHNERTCIVKETEIIDVGPWQYTYEADSYYKHLENTNDSNISLNVYMNYIDYYLDKKSILHYTTIAIDDEFYRCDFNNTDLMQTSFHNIRAKHGKAKDGLHPNRNAHKEYANELYKEINT